MTMEEYFNAHGSVIVTSYEDREVGDTIDHIDVSLPGQNKTVFHTFFVKRVATKDEYIAQCRKMGITKRHIVCWDYFYEVTSD